MKKQKCHPDSGFSLLEVVVAIVIVTFFTTVTMQMMVISAAFKAKAKDYTTATNLIQKDLELVRSKAVEYEFPLASPTPITLPNPTASPSPTSMAIPLTSVDGFDVVASPNQQEVQFEGTADVYKVVGKVTSPTPVVTISPIMTSQPPSGSKLINNTLCNNSTISTGLAEKLRLKTVTNLATPSPAPTGNLAGYGSVSGYAPYTIPNTQKKLWLMRKDTNVNTPPYDVLNIKYLVVKATTDGNPDPNQIVAKLSTEVIPNASFQCLKQ
ncbi:MAG: type II secretion system protein [Nostocales cyanobacterium]|nr:MAG: type II secretion system protein [Nostocales cyanobacterium]